MNATDLESSEAQEYFLEVERIFNGLREVGQILSAHDRAFAVRWFELGVPLEVVRRGLDEVFAKRKTLRAKKQLSSLRYCAPAVERLWEQTQRLMAAGITVAPAVLEVAPRLEALAAALPAELPRLESWRGRILGLEGPTESVEQALAEIDRELAASLLAQAEPAEIEARIATALRNLASRLSPGELAEARERMATQIVRQRWKLPVLSLFAPEAEQGSAVTDPAP